jgi:hypothetical protein
MRLTTGLCLAAVCAAAIAASAEAGQATRDKTKANAGNAQAVTVTGCLVHDEHSYRLTRVSGAEAPKSRNWRSLYVKKSTPRFEVVDGSGKLALKDHVGQTVKITGTVSGERQLRPRSVQRVSSSCS